MTGRLTIKRGEQRDRVETAMFALRNAIRDLDEIILRNQQAMRRSTHVHAVLDPALDRLVTVRQAVMAARRELNEYWVEQQKRRWSDDHSDKNT